MKARDIMSSGTECVSASDTLETAARRMAEAGRRSDADLRRRRSPEGDADGSRHRREGDRSRQGRGPHAGLRARGGQAGHDRRRRLGTRDARDDGTRAGSAAAGDRRTPPGGHHQRGRHRSSPFASQERQAAAGDLEASAPRARVAACAGRAGRRCRWPAPATSCARDVRDSARVDPPEHRRQRAGPLGL